MWKKGWHFEPKPGNNDRAFAPTNTTKVNKIHTNLPHKPNNERRRWVRRRWVKKGECKKVTSKDQLQPSDTPRAPSGPERIYWPMGPPGIRGNDRLHRVSPLLHHPVPLHSPASGPYFWLSVSIIQLLLCPVNLSEFRWRFSIDFRWIWVSLLVLFSWSAHAF